MNVKRKIPNVKLRMRKLSTGRTQLFMDITISGKRSRESLNLYLEPGTSRLVKDKNKETLLLAQSVVAKRQELERDIANGIEIIRDGGEYPFFEYVREHVKKKTEASQTTWGTLMVHLSEYEHNELIPLSRINSKWLDGFRTYLQKKAKKHVLANGVMHTLDQQICANSAQQIWRKVIEVINDANKEGYLHKVPKYETKPFEGRSNPKKEYLTPEEMKLLLATPLPPGPKARKNELWMPDACRRVFIFSAMTGLRISDATKLKWGDVTMSPEGHARIVYRQKKTNEMNYLDINTIAVEQLGERGDPEDVIFPLKNECVNDNIKRWMELAGIKKHITFHCSRHTNAVLLLTSGTDIFTVQKMLGHRSLASTMVYAKILDEKKSQAADRLANMF